MPTEASSVGGPLQQHRHRRRRQLSARQEDKRQDPAAPMLQPPVSLLEMASLRLPDSDEFDLERRRGQAAAAAAAEATRQSSHQHPSVVSTTGGIVVGGVGGVGGGGGLTALGELRNLVGSRAELLADYVNGSLQDLFVLASTHRPGGSTQSMSPTELGSGASGSGVGAGLSLGGLVDPTSAVVDDDFVLQALFNATTSGGGSVNNLSLEHVSDRYYRHSVAMSVVYFVAYCLVFVVGLIGNSFVIAVVYRSPRMRTVTNFFIVNLAVADVLVIVFCLPATLMSNIFVPWVLGWFMCKTVPYIQGVSVAASVYSLVAVSLDRFLAIWWPLRCQITKSRARMMIIVIWFIALTTTSPWLLFFDLVSIYNDDPDVKLCMEIWPRPLDGTLFFIIGNLMLCYVLPMILISLCYVLIWIKVWRRDIPSDTKDDQMERLQQKSKVKVVKMLIIVVILFVLSWLPLYVIFARIKLGGKIAEWEEELLPIATPIAQWLGSSNSCINPILYAFFNKKYRRGFMAIIKSGQCCGKLRYYETVAIMSSSTSMRKSSYYVNNSSSQRRAFHGPPVHQDSNVSYIFNHKSAPA